MNNIIPFKLDSSSSTQVSATVCSNCGTSTTPLWRRAPNGDTICNACGLYLKAKNVLRPTTMKRHGKNLNPITAANAPGGTCPGNGQCNGTGGSPSCAGCPVFNQHQVNRQSLCCFNCHTTTTPLWRRDGENNTICNACGLYYKLHNKHRPVAMKRTMIKRRRRMVNTDKPENDDEYDELDSSNDDDNDDEEKVKQKRYDPLCDYRKTNDNPYQDLVQFDDAMTRLERLRRRLLPEQTKILSKLTSNLEDIVNKAEKILQDN